MRGRLAVGIALILCGVLAAARAAEPPPCTAALQARIDALAAKGGGTLVITSGVHRTGAIFFKPGVDLHLEKGAVLLGVDEEDGYPKRLTRIQGEMHEYYPALVNADRCDGFRISGEGVIDGHGYPTWKAFWDFLKHKGPDTPVLKLNCPDGVVRPRLLFVSNSRDVDVSGVTFKNSKFWTTHYYKCRDVRVHDCTIVAERIRGVKGPSTDAIDIDACNGFLVSNVVMNVNDDAIALKGGRGEDADDPVKRPDNGATENVLVTDCTFGPQCHCCLTLGSECFRARNVTLRNSKVSASRLLWLKTRLEIPQLYENILVENCTGRVWSYMACGLYAYEQSLPLLRGREPPEKVFRNVTMRNNDVKWTKFVDSSNKPYLKYENFNIEKKEVK